MIVYRVCCLLALNIFSKGLLSTRCNVFSSQFYTRLHRPLQLNAMKSEPAAKDSSISFRQWPSTFESEKNLKAILLYLPGLESLGISAEESQFPSLSDSFDLYSMVIEKSNRSTFQDITEACINFLEKKLKEYNKDTLKSSATVIGESFGGMLALAIASVRPDLVNEIFLVNPATSFTSTFWPKAAEVLQNIPSQLYPVASLGIFLSTIPDNEQIFDLVGLAFDPRKNISIVNRSTELLNRYTTLQRDILKVAENLPQDTLAWRIQNWLIDGNTVVAPLLDDISVPVTVIAGSSDKLLPSSKEASRLASVIKNCKIVNLEGHGHVPFYDSRSNLSEIIMKNMSSESKKIIQENAEIMKKKRIEKEKLEYDPPSRNILDLTVASLGPLKRAVSPVFISTQGDGTLVEGLSALPEYNATKAILFVANHQYLGNDIGLIYERLLGEKGFLPRGLAHPVIFDGNAFPGIMGELFKTMITSFGAVPVSGKNMYRLLMSKEAVLLFPGGAREALHLRGEENKLMWPEKAEIIRMAASTNTTIIPISAVGLAESYQTILDSNELLNIPLLGPYIKDRIKNNPSMRENDTFLFPVAIPKLPRRQYFRFGKPIYAERIDKNDRRMCEEAYINLKNDIEKGIQLLLQARKMDEFDDPKRRFLYEVTSGGKVAPTFSMEYINRLQQEMQ